MTTTAVQAETRTMAALVETLKGEGVEIEHYQDLGQATNETEIFFNCENETQAYEIADRVIGLGYPLTEIISHSCYSNGERRKSSRLMVFSMSDRWNAVHR